MTDTAPAPSRRRENTRTRLMDAAAEMFAEVGIDAASVEAICERAGFTRGAFYSNFASKEELFLALCARSAETTVAAVRERVTSIEDRGLDATGEVLHLVQEVLEVTGDDRLDVLLGAEIRVQALRNPEFAEAYLALNRELGESVAQLVGDIAEEGAHAARDGGGRDRGHPLGVGVDDRDRTDDASHPERVAGAPRSAPRAARAAHPRVSSS